MRKVNRLFVILALGLLGPAAACLAADADPKTGETRDTLLYVQTVPPGAKVFLNGKQLGSSNGLFPVEPGTGTILVELEGRQPDKRPVMIRANGITRLEIELKSTAKSKGRSGNTAASVAGPVKPVPYTIGVNWFHEGDAITITEVDASSPDLKAGDRVVAKGYYTLATEPEASLCLFATATEGSGRSPIQPFQTMGVKKGQASFELSETLEGDNYLHVTFYRADTGKGFGGLYFGTAKQMEAIKNWDVRRWYTEDDKPAAARKN